VIDYATGVLNALDEEFTAQVVADVAYQHDPIRWMHDVLGIDRRTIVWSENPGYEHHEWDGTPDPLKVVCDALADGKDVGIEAGTGTQKTYTAAALALWFLACFEDSIVVTTAPIEKQLTLHMWKWVGHFWDRFSRRFPSAELIQLHVRMKGEVAEKETWAAVGYACGVDAGADSATRAQGFHAQHMLIVTEETPGIDPAIMTALENTRTSKHNIWLALGNPDHQADALHDFCIQPNVVHVRISALDHPNVIMGHEFVLGACSRESNARRLARYGEDGRLYQSRVRGISPKESAEALIKWDWCVAASKRAGQPMMRVGSSSMGVDVANSENGDLAAVAIWQGATLEELYAFPCPDPVALAFKIKVYLRAFDVDPYRVGVDSVAVGAATVGRLKEMDLIVRSLNGGASAMSQGEEEFPNLRSQMWWQMRLDLQQGLVALPYDESLFRDLCAPTWEPKNGKIYVEPKESIQKRLGRSPDRGDACVYGNWVRDREPLTSTVRFRRPDEETLAAFDQRDEEFVMDTEDADVYGDTLDQS